uniref:Uncharacterized protein n=1 Tax=Faecalibaculum rodentium TaxID=1702221 RepID=A0A140DS77_9FIRM|nr:hypothetical protein AALO17_03700 [Faecalibaculum rodentium]
MTEAVSWSSNRTGTDRIIETGSYGCSEELHPFLCIFFI